MDWNDISNASAIIEVGLPSFYVEPSFGSHFFQNLSSLGVDYFFTTPKIYQTSICHDWLASIKPFKETSNLKLLRFQEPITIQVNGKKEQGFVLKPGAINKDERSE